MIINKLNGSIQVGEKTLPIKDFQIEETLIDVDSTDVERFNAAARGLRQTYSVMLELSRDGVTITPTGPVVESTVEEV